MNDTMTHTEEQEDMLNGTERLEQLEALDRLQQILEELEELGTEARDLIKNHWPDRLSHADGYGVFSFGNSWNRYNQTLTTVVESIQDELDNPDAE